MIAIEAENQSSRKQTKRKWLYANDIQASRYPERYTRDYALLGIAALLVNPVGDFPLNDDWSYGLTMMRLLDEGVFAPTEWTSMPLISQALWGALFCLPLGFSFTALRISSMLTLSLLGVLGLYAMIRLGERPHWLALAAVFTFAQKQQG